MSRFAVIPFWFFVILSINACSAPAPGDRNKPGAALPPPPVEFKAQVDKAVATVGDLITLTLSLSSEPQIAVRFPEAGSRIAGLPIVDDGQEGPKMVDNRTVQKKWYKFQPDSVGSYIIPALSVTYTDARGAQQELKSAQLFIEIKSVLQDKNAKATGEIRDIKPLQEIPWSPGQPLIYGALMVLLLLVGGVFLFYYRGKKKNQLPAPPDPAHVRAFKELEQLSREQLLERGIVREYYFRLSEIFRRYIERRFHIPAVERTTEEIMPDILSLQACGSALKAEMRQILRYADLVKFARFCPDRNTSDNDYRNVVRVIEETKEVPPAGNAALPDVPAE